MQKSLQVRTLIEKLDFSPELVIDAAAEQPKLFLRAAEYRMAKFRDRQQKDAALSALRASLSLKKRRVARQGGERVTEAHLGEALLTHPAIHDAQEALNSVIEQEEWAKLLLEAYRMRRDCIKVVGEMSAVEISVQRAMRAQSVAAAGDLTDIREKVRRRYPGLGDEL